MTPLTDDPRWDQVMAGMATYLRGQGKLVVGQQHQLTGAVLACNGAWLEQSPTSFGYTIERHAKDIATFRSMMAMAHDTRESIFVVEVRDPTIYPAWYLDSIKDWASSTNLFISAGVDATAGAAL